MNKISFIGAGNMGSALIRGLVRSKQAAANMISVFDADSVKSQSLEKELGIRAVASLEDTLAPDTSMLLLAVKPQTIGEVVRSVADKIHDKLVVISIAAGIPTSFILSCLNKPARVIRAMPNAAAMAGRSATALCKAGIADEADLEMALGLFRAVGAAVALEEKMMNVVTALSSSGLAYLFVIMEALTDAAVRMGMDRPTARQLSVETVMGAATMAEGTVPFSELKDRITSPGGTTMAALHVIERGGLRGIIMDAVEAATRRGDELAQQK
ncbi:MAG: pyrroline-5-carboxylate reductase [Desulfomonile tiedjei]|nr:pyrroline-5-carboxylate reductase [Desulfomonile tiedjei]